MIQICQGLLNMVKEQSVSYNVDILSTIFSFITSIVNKIDTDPSSLEGFLFYFLSNQNQTLCSLAQQCIYIIFNKYTDRLNDSRY